MDSPEGGESGPPRGRPLRASKPSVRRGADGQIRSLPSQPFRELGRAGLLSPLTRFFVVRLAGSWESWAELVDRTGAGPLPVWRSAEGQGAAFLMSIFIDFETGCPENPFLKD